MRTHAHILVLVRMPFFVSAVHLVCGACNWKKSVNQFKRIGNNVPSSSLLEFDFLCFYLCSCQFINAYFLIKKENKNNIARRKKTTTKKGVFSSSPPFFYFSLFFHVFSFYVFSLFWGRGEDFDFFFIFFSFSYLFLFFFPLFYYYVFFSFLRFPLSSLTFLSDPSLVGPPLSFFVPLLFGGGSSSIRPFTPTLMVVLIRRSFRLGFSHEYKTKC